MQQFINAQQSDDPTATTRSTHTLKGTAANIGATAIQLAALKLENCCRQGVEDEAIGTALQQVELEDVVLLTLSL